MEKPDNKPKNVHEVINQEFLASLKAGSVPWTTTWAGTGPPMNPYTNEQYHGVNHVLLNSLEYPKNYFLTLKQVNKMGGHVRRGEKGHLVSIVAKGKVDKETGKQEKPSLKLYRVFNIDQTIGVNQEKMPVIEKANESPTIAFEKMLAAMPNKPKLKTDIEVYFDPLYDTIHIPDKSKFQDDISYYRSLFKLIISSTNHPDRLGKATGRSSDHVSNNDLSQEIAWQYFRNLAGVPSHNEPLSREEREFWIKTLKANERLVAMAASKAQNSISYMLNDPYLERILAWDKKIKKDERSIDRKLTRSIDREEKLKEIRERNQTNEQSKSLNR